MSLVGPNLAGSLVTNGAIIALQGDLLMSDTPLRDTPYATEIATASIAFDGANEGRIEHIHVKDEGQDEIRFSWWKDGRMMMRPLDLPENDLLTLLDNAIKGGVFTLDFRAKLRDML
jgi:hypothetical protein